MTASTITLSASPSQADSSSLSVRLLGEDRLPEKFLFDPLVRVPELDGNWVWVVENAGEIVGFLIASPCHGAAHVLRARLEAQVPSMALVVLLRRFFRDCRARGLRGFFGYFDLQSDIENRLALLITKVEGQIWASPMVAVAAPIPREGL